MSGARATRHSIAIGAAALIVLATAVGSVQAASPRPVPLDQLRPARHAWDRPPADDPGRLIVTFRPGTSTRSRRAAIGGAGATTDADLGASLSVGVRARSGTAATTLSTLQADERVLQVSVDHKRYREADPTDEPAWRELWGLDNTGQDILQGTPSPAARPTSTSTAARRCGITTGVGEHGRRGHRRRGRLQPSGPGRAGLDEPGRVGRRQGDQRDRRRRQRLRRRRPRLGLLPRRQHRPRRRRRLPRHARRRDDRGVARRAGRRRRRAGRLDHGPQVPRRRRRLRLRLEAIAAIAYAKSFGVRIANASWGAAGRPTGFAGPVRTRSRPRGCCSWPRPATAAPTTTTARRRPCRRRSTCRTSCRSAAVDNTGGLTSFSNYGRRTVDIVAPGESHPEQPAGRRGSSRRRAGAGSTGRRWRRRT